MSDFLTRNQLVLAKVETTPGTDIVPTPAADSVLVDAPRGNPNMQLEQTDEATGSLSNSQSIVGGGYREGSRMFYAKSSGVPGTAPEFAPYLQAAALGMTTLAVDSAGTAQAGAAGQITLAVAAPSANLAGFVIETTGGTGPGQRRVIKSYNTATKVAVVYPNFTVIPDATTTYAVRAGNVFAPVSTALKTLSEYRYKKNAGSGNAVLEKMVGAMNGLSFAVESGKTGKFTASLRGQLLAPIDVANPVGAVFDSVRPRPMLNSDAFLDGVAVCFRNFTLDFGLEMTQPDCPGQLFGYDPTIITNRKVTGRLNPRQVTLSQRNPFADMVAGTTKPLWLNWGETLGNKVSMLLPAISYTGNEEDDLDKVMADGLPFDANGFDGEVLICFY